MKLEWDISECSCHVASGYVGNHDGAHKSESPYGTYMVEPWGQGDQFHATFRCDCCGALTELAEGVAWRAAYEAAKEHFREMFSRRMTYRSVVSP